MDRVRLKTTKNVKVLFLLIIALWELSIATETRVLIQSAPKPNDSDTTITFNCDRHIGLRDILRTGQKSTYRTSIVALSKD